MVCVVVVAALYLVQLLAIAPVILSANISLPNCMSKCGEVNIPYPFGIGDGCYREGFNLTCDEAYNPPKLFLVNGGAEVLNISLQHGTMYIDNGITRLTGSDEYRINWRIPLDDSIFIVSESRNKFIVLGCGFLFLVKLPDSEETVVACASSCLRGHHAVSTDGTCSGVGCCETSLPGARNIYSIELIPFRSTNSLPRPGQLFNATMVMVEKEWWDSKDHAMSLQKEISAGLHTRTVPDSAMLMGIKTAVKWKFSNLSCVEAKRSGNFGCLSHNSYCLDSTSTPQGYLCHCRNGFEGNPYISDGCHDVDECTHPDEYPCFAHCINTVGSYICICPEGTSGNPFKPDGCTEDGAKLFSGSAVATGVGSGTGLVFLTFAGILFRRKLKVRKEKQLRDFFFKKNRGLLLQQLVDKDIAEKMIFSLEELEKATNKFDEARKIGNGGHGNIYKGILSDQRVVAIKKSRHAIQCETDNFINEVAILSQLNHRNVVKLFGCCFETEVPLLVYEFISNGTLHDHLHVSFQRSLTWDVRLRIILEVARCLAYLHLAASISIIHRDIKATNILLDDNLTAKVADFGASRGIPIDQSRVTTAIQGTFGYLDPECYHTNQITEKSDVYSFGVILVELLTRKKPQAYMSPLGKSLLSHFLLLHGQDKLSEILDPQVTNEGEEEARQVAEIAAMCLSPNGEDRPTMKQVEMRLESLQGVLSNIDNSSKTEERTLSISSVGDLHGTGSDNSSRRYSMEREFLHSMSLPR